MHADFLNHAQLGWVGGPPDVDSRKLEALLGMANVLVVSPVSLGPRGSLLNVNADLAAQTIAVALKARRLDFVTDVDGVCAEGETVRSLASTQIERMIQDSIVHGGMIPKLQASLAALDGGVSRVCVGNLTSLRRGTATEVHV
jgi:acetylglutamate kinase